MHSLFVVAVLASLAVLSNGHGHLLAPNPRWKVNGLSNLADNVNGPSPLTSNFVCRSRPSATPTVSLQAGNTVNFMWNFTAVHVGDCAIYISYDGQDSVADSDKTWFKIANIYDCRSRLGTNVPVYIPEYLPSCTRCILRWEWYALHVRPTIEYYSECTDVTINGCSGGIMPTPTFKIPGHLPVDGNQYRNAFSPNDAPTKAVVGPLVANISVAVPSGCNAQVANPNPSYDYGESYVAPTGPTGKGGGGSCGSVSDCSAGYCCSKYGYCGTTAEYCGTNAITEATYTAPTGITNTNSGGNPKVNTNTNVVGSFADTLYAGFFLLVASVALLL